MWVWDAFLYRLNSIWNAVYCMVQLFSPSSFLGKGSCNHGEIAITRGVNWSPTIFYSIPLWCCIQLLFVVGEECGGGPNHADHAGCLQLHQPLQRGPGPGERLPIDWSSTPREEIRPSTHKELSSSTWRPQLPRRCGFWSSLRSSFLLGRGSMPSLQT